MTSQIRVIAPYLIAIVLCGCASNRPVHHGQGDTLPPELEEVLRNYETAWRNKDAAGLASLFAEDGYVLPNGAPPVHGRETIETSYQGAGGPLYLRALAWAMEGRTGYIIGEYSHSPDFVNPGKFTLTLVRKNESDDWLIMSDMDNGNTRPPR